MFRAYSRRLAALVFVAGLGAIAFGCSSGGETGGGSGSTTKATTAAGGSTSGGASAAVSAELAEWSVKAAGPAKAGKVEFNVKNSGTTPHELVILKTDADPASLTKDASARVDESKYPPVARTKELNGGGTEKLEATLTAGKYVLVCNLSGHYDLGMRTGFTVN